jgi:hypothetical protein
VTSAQEVQGKTSAAEQQVPLRGLPNSRLQLAAKLLVKLCLGASRVSPEFATIALVAPVWHAGEVAAWTNAAAAEA